MPCQDCDDVGVRTVTPRQLAWIPLPGNKLVWEKPDGQLHRFEAGQPQRLMVLCRCEHQPKSPA